MEVALYSDASITLGYHNIGLGVYPERNLTFSGYASTGWPELNQFMAACQKTVAKSGDIVTTKLYRNVKNSAPAIPSNLTKTFVLLSHREATAKYSQRLEAGEVFMNPYTTGQVKVSRTVGIVVPPNLPMNGDIAAEAGWFESGKFLAFMNARGLYPPVPPPYKDGVPLRGYSVFLMWRWVTLPDSALYVSPDYIPPYVVPDLVIDEGMVTAVVADASDGELDLLTEVAELPETLGFLGESVKQALCLTADLEEEARRMRKRMPGARFVEWFSNHWLKGRYALLPIFYSIKDIQAVLKSLDREYGRYSQKADVDCLLGNIQVLGCKVDIEHQAVARCVMKVRYTITSLLDSLQRALNINLFATLWELKAFSFVADWAFNIGDFIQAATGSTGATEMCTSFSVKDTSIITLTYNNDTMPAATTVALNIYRREIINPYDHIGLEFVLGRNLNWKRSVDAFALSARPGLRRFESVLKKQGAI